MKLFRKGKKMEDGKQTLQEIQADFNKLMNEITQLERERYVLSERLEQVKEQIKGKHRQGDKLAEEANLVRSKVKEELDKTIKQGEKHEEAPKAD